MNTLSTDTTGRILKAGHASTARTLPAHFATHGALMFDEKDDAWRARLLGAIAASGVGGRGGAGFAASRKWAAVSGRRRPPVVVVNAMEGEPASAKDRVLLSQAPHLVLDGAELAAAAVGATAITVCIADHNTDAAGWVEYAIAERTLAGRVSCPVSVVRPPARYVSGEESALVAWLSNRRSLPALRVDKSVPLELSHRPVLVHNAETLSHVALIARHGPAWFRQQGTEEAPGTTLVTVSGAVRSPGVIEVALGTPLARILALAGLETELSGVLLGGYGGAWLSASLLDTPYAPRPLAAAGATLGVGVIIALPKAACGIAETARIARYMAGQSAGQCGPCVFGLPAVAADLEQLAAGCPDPELIERIGKRAASIEGRGACRHPDGLVRLVRSAMSVFADDVVAHAHARPCVGHHAPTLMTFPDDPIIRRWAS